MIVAYEGRIPANAVVEHSSAGVEMLLKLWARYRADCAFILKFDHKLPNILEIPELFILSDVANGLKKRERRRGGDENL